MPKGSVPGSTLRIRQEDRSSSWQVISAEAPERNAARLQVFEISQLGKTSNTIHKHSTRFGFCLNHSCQLDSIVS